MVSIGSLTEEQRQELRRLRRRAVGRVAERAQMVLLSARGYSVARITEIFEVGQDVVRTWLHRYQREGAAGLLAAFVAWRYHLVLSPASVRRLLHAAGWRWGRPRLAPATHAPGTQRQS